MDCVPQDMVDAFTSVVRPLSMAGGDKKFFSNKSGRAANGDTRVDINHDFFNKNQKIRFF